MDEAHGTDIFGATIPFARHCGIEAVDANEDRTLLRLELRAEHGNNLGNAHGGLICTALDVAMGTAARLKLGAPVMTLDMNVSFLSIGRGTLMAEGRVLRAGRSIVFCEAVLTGPDGGVVAKSSGVFKTASHRSSAAGDG
ncbi:PaaI family thioesterase [Aureimonas mangrovi]|uniref:PaaI family thioesterase n=1 Tax=Aureimonas mangrovi TaxID=2758041 RepID=UPI00163D746C|nr:PaaI family thioesterase [Aureimonas mangrovi]